MFRFRPFVLGGLALLGLAASPIRADLPYLYSIGAGILNDAADVAVYDTEGIAHFVFVADWGLHRVVRFASAGQPGAGSFVFPAAFFTDGPTGIAVNDIPGHCNEGQVYVTDRDLASGFGFLHVFDANGVPLKQVAWDENGSNGFHEPVGVAVDRVGDVYVADRAPGFGRVARFAASNFGPPFNLSILAPAAQIFSSSPFGPANDVSVDVGGRVHVVNECGCFKVFEPDGTLIQLVGGFALPIIERHGVDALDIKGRTWASGDAVHRYEWNWTDLNAHGPTLGLQPSTGGRGLESAKLARWIWGSSGTVGTRWEQRLFVSGGGQIEVFGQDAVSTPHPPGAVAWWRFEERQSQCGGTPQAVRDQLGLNSGTLVSGSAPATTEGVVRNGFSSNAGQSSVVVADSPTLDFGTGSFSVEGWIMTRQTLSQASFLDKRQGLGNGFLLFTSNGHLGLQINEDGLTYANYTPQVPENFIADGTWNHFAVVCERPGAGVTFYVNGVAVPGTIAPLSTDISNNEPLYIGQGNPTAFDTAFRGFLDELTVYARALSSAEVATIATAESAGKEIALSVPTVYCTAKVNSLGCTPAISWAGVPSATAMSGFTVFSTNMRSNSAGILIYSLTGRQDIPFQGGTLCIATPIQRTPVINSGGNPPPADCSGVYSRDMNEYAVTHPALAQPGIRVNCQFWGRDTGFAAPNNTQLSDALEYIVGP